MARTPEFIDTYSDDLLYLMDMRDSHLTHPGKMPIQLLFQSSIARIFCAFMVGNIEAMLEHWRDRDVNGILAPYFAQSSNEVRIQSLISNFQENGIAINEQILKRYLAIKYVRNTIIHSSWNPNQENYIAQMGFPTDTRELNDSHLQIMYVVNAEMIKYIAATEHKEFASIPSDNTLPIPKKYFSRTQLMGFLWNNLERIYEEVRSSTTITEDLFEEALFDWMVFKEHAVANRIDLKNLDQHIAILQSLVDGKKYSIIPIGNFIFEGIFSDESSQADTIAVLEQLSGLKRVELIPFTEALVNGKKCYSSIRNGIIVALFDKLKDTKSSFAEDPIHQEFKLATKLFKLSRLYYDYLERR